MNLSIQGTELAPIWIVAKTGETPRIYRNGQSQNIMNIGVLSSGASKYVAFRGIEFEGGDAGLRLYSCSNVWLDQCHIHHVGDAALTTNTENTDHIYITRNHIHHTTDTGEGMYLGANNGAKIMRDSIIALNHVHDTGGVQGDGIELKQGSYNNWIAENIVHDNHYPSILVYGTNGQPVNVIERNICFNSGDNTMQVQGEAIVRNNLIMHGANGFFSSDHQGQTINLSFIHNTVINIGTAARLTSWNNRQGMVFANNVVYSQTSNSAMFSGGSTGVIVTGNVRFGSLSGVTSSGFIQGTGLNDFESVAWDASLLDATPSVGSPIIGAGNPVYAVTTDISGATRSGSLEAGAFDLP